ncbi:conjugative relaxase-like TrwC/TraI family protein [Paraburkholderia unamae]|uniref:MobF family relaxase n=1 Tax=Paraburkholderia unamae TaxID=219649 RepID=UPI000DC27093|nr:MobF family relaxase [Paraburkholderia unamae]RAR66886.1 conjugative relaxase-like TrwC/TraI family protein [Paraburkholderia unamae]
MIGFTPLNKAGVGPKGQNIMKYLKQTEYYRNADGAMESPTRWAGDGPASLGLSGKVDFTVLDKLAAGRAPDGTPLVANAGKDHVIGYELTFSPDKTFSLAWAQAGDAERADLLAAHRAAVDKGLEYLKENLEVRVGAGGLERQKCTELFAAGFTHFTSRNLDPQVHEHMLVFNVVRGEDGKTRAMNTRDLAQHRYVMDQVYKGTLAHELQQRGFAVRQEIEVHKQNGRETGNVYYKIDGITREAEEAESSRRTELLEYAKKAGVSNQQAALATRKDKDEPTFAELETMWRQSLAPLHEGGLLPTNDQLKQRPQQALTIREDHALLMKLHKTEANVSRRDIVGLIAAEAGPAFAGDLRKLDGMVDGFMQRNGFVQKPANTRGQVMYTSQWMINEERSLRDIDLQLRANTAHNLAPEVVQKALDAYERRKTAEFQAGKTPEELKAGLAAVATAEADLAKAATPGDVALAEKALGVARRKAGIARLTEEQRRNVEYATMQTGGIANLVGWAGTGKTFTAQAFVDAYREAGYEVVGTTSGWNASGKLASEVEGMDARALASLLAKLETGAVKLDAKSLVLIDEAGMVGTLDRVRIERYVAAAGGKIIATGDPRQLKSPSAGDSYRLSIAAVGMVEMTDVQRQASEEHRKTVAELYAADNGLETFKRMKAHDHIVEVEVSQADRDAGRERETIQKQIAKDWGQSIVAVEQKAIEDDKPKSQAQLIKDHMVIATSNEDVRGLNAAIRAQAREQRLITGDDVTLMVVPKADALGDAVPKNFAVGERIQFLEKHDDLAAAKKSLKILEANIGKAKRGEVVTDFKTGKTLTLADLQARLPEAQRTLRLAPLGVSNGTNAIIDRIVDQGNGHHTVHATLLDDIKVDKNGRQQNGRRVSWSTADLNAFDQAWAITNHGGQGKGEDHVFVMTNTIDANDSILVQFTREKKMVRFYGTANEFKHFPEALETLTVKGNATDDLPAQHRDAHEQAQHEKATTEAAEKRQALAETAREQLTGMGLTAEATAHDRRADVVAAMAARHAERVREHPEQPPVTAAVNPRDVPALNEAIRAELRANGVITGNDVTLTVARGGDFNPPSFRPEPDARVAKNEDGDRYFRGVLVATGTGLVDPADPTSRSPYATVRTRDGHEHQVFGVDVAPAIERGGVKPGDTIELRRTGEQPVEITDRKTGETKVVMRNGWEAVPHDFAAHEQQQRDAYTVEVQRQRDAAETPTTTADLNLAAGDVVTFGSRGAALYHGITDPSARLTITAIDGTDPANPKATARWNGQDFTLTNGDQIEHAHAVPAWKAARDAKTQDGPTPFVQIMASSAEPESEPGGQPARNLIDPQALRDLNAKADTLHVHGTAQSFRATARAYADHLEQRYELTARADDATRSINRSTTLQITEKPDDAVKALAQAFVASEAPEQDRLAVGSTPRDVSNITDAIRSAKREAGQITGEDHAVRVRASTASVEMPVAAGDRLVLRSNKTLSLALPVRLEEPMAATLHLNAVARGADGVLRATATVESPNERDRQNGQAVLLDEDNLKRFRHAYATTQKDAAEHPRPHVFALVGERDAPARVENALKPAGQAEVFATPKAAQRLTEYVEAGARAKEQAVANKAATAERAAAGRDAIRGMIEKREADERARQQAIDAQRKADEQAKQAEAAARAKQQREAQAQEKKALELAAQREAQQQRRGRGIRM